MVVADVAQPRILAERIIQVHCPAARHHEDVADAVSHERLGDVVANLDQFLPFLFTNLQASLVSP